MTFASPVSPSALAFFSFFAFFSFLAVGAPAGREARRRRARQRLAHRRRPSSERARAKAAEGGQLGRGTFALLGGLLRALGGRLRLGVLHLGRAARRLRLVVFGLRAARQGGAARWREGGGGGGGDGKLLTRGRARQACRQRACSTPRAPRCTMALGVEALEFVLRTPAALFIASQNERRFLTRNGRLSNHLKTVSHLQRT